MKGDIVQTQLTMTYPVMVEGETLTLVGEIVQDCSAVGQLVAVLQQMLLSCSELVKMLTTVQ